MASSCLIDLERLHEVELVMAANQLRRFNQAHRSLHRLSSAFVAEYVEPTLTDGAPSLDDAMALDKDGPHSDHVKARLQSLVAWHDRALQILPIRALHAAPSSNS